MRSFVLFYNYKRLALFLNWTLTSWKEFSLRQAELVWFEGFLPTSPYMTVWGSLESIFVLIHVQTDHGLKQEGVSASYLDDVP